MNKPLQSLNSNAQPEVIKIIEAGPGSCGKTTLAIVYVTGEYVDTKLTVGIDWHTDDKKKIPSSEFKNSNRPEIISLFSFNQYELETLGKYNHGLCDKIKDVNLLEKLNKIFRPAIWDFGGQERFGDEQTPSYSRTKTTLLFFDLTYDITFQQLFEPFESESGTTVDPWYKRVRDNTGMPLKDAKGAVTLKYGIPVFLVGNKLDIIVKNVKEGMATWSDYSGLFDEMKNKVEEYHLAGAYLTSAKCSKEGKRFQTEGWAIPLDEFMVNYTKPDFDIAKIVKPVDYMYFHATAAAAAYNAKLAHIERGF